MDWYMEKKIPHVLGHEVCGEVIESQDARFATGQRIFAHHHAPCLTCDMCTRGNHVHCDQWKQTKLIPGGMAEIFGVPKENLNDTFAVDDLRPVDAALIEPLACVIKSLQLAPQDDAAVVGLGVMGLMHMKMLPANAIGYDLNSARIDWARRRGLRAELPSEAMMASAVFVCPGSQQAFNFAISIVKPGGSVVMFAPLSPDETLVVPQSVYFNEVKILSAYSCGPEETTLAAKALGTGVLAAEDVVSNFIDLASLPEAYQLMKKGEILKPMVTFETLAS